MKLVRITVAQIIKGFTVRLLFNDGTEKTVDLEPYFHGPIFEPLRKDPAVFRSMRINKRMGTIAWDNGADIDPDVLYHGLTPAWMESDVPRVAEPKPGRPSSKNGV